MDACNKKVIVVKVDIGNGDEMRRILTNDGDRIIWILARLSIFLRRGQPRSNDLKEQLAMVRKRRSSLLILFFGSEHHLTIASP